MRKALLKMLAKIVSVALIVTALFFVKEVMTNDFSATDADSAVGTVTGTTEFTQNVPATTTMYVANTSTLNVREAATASSKKLGTLTYGESVVVIGPMENGWFQILYKDTVAYVSGKYLSTNKPTTLEGVVVGEGVTESMKSTFLRYYSLVPQYVKDYVAVTGGTIMLDKDGRFTNGHAGTYHIGHGNMCINGATPGKIKLAAIHEQGHHIDYVLGKKYGVVVKSGYYEGYNFFSGSDEFVAIYNAEVGKSGYGSWATYAAAEYFAESFRYYFEDQQRVATNTPQTYAYLQKIMAMIQSELAELAEQSEQ